MKHFIHKQFNKLKHFIMANNAELSAKVDALTNAIATERQQFIDTIAAKDAQITDLQNQLNNAQGGISASDADAIGARIDQATSDVAGIVP